MAMQSLCLHTENINQEYKRAYFYRIIMFMHHGTAKFHNIHRVYEKWLSGLTWYSCYLRMQKANNCTNLPSERLYNKWFVSVPAELLWIPAFANYKQEID